MTDFVINQMTLRNKSSEEALKISAGLGCIGLEFRNDLSPPLFEVLTPKSLLDRANMYNQRILAIAEVKKFNDFSEKNLQRAKELIDLAFACGAESVVFVPSNDGTEADISDISAALQAYAPMLRNSGIKGIIEPLGFQSSSLQTKRKTVDAIEMSGCGDVYAIVHDTFHHYIASESEIFADFTGIVHVSGVTDSSLSPEAMMDEHRTFVDQDDCIRNIDQLSQLFSDGYTGPVSFELFAPEVHKLIDPMPQLEKTIHYIAACI